MTLNEIRLTKYNEVVKFIEINKRNLSKHRLESHDILNWLKANGREMMNAEEIKEPRLLMF